TPKQWRSRPGGDRLIHGDRKNVTSPSLRRRDTNARGHPAAVHDPPRRDATQRTGLRPSWWRWHVVAATRRIATGAGPAILHAIGVASTPRRHAFQAIVTRTDPTNPVKRAIR